MNGWRVPTVDEVVDVAITVGLGVLLSVGFLSSYTTLLDVAVTAGGYPAWLAPAVPLAFDLGIVVLSLKVVRAAREGRTAPVLRVLVLVLSVATVAANASAANTAAGAVLHAVPPAMFVVCFESVIASTRRHALERLGLVPPKLPRVRGVRWLLAPWPTFTSWRTAVLERDLFEQDEPASSGQPLTRRPNPDGLVAGSAAAAELSAPGRPCKTSRVEVDPRAIARELHRHRRLSRRSLTAAVRKAGGALGTDNADQIIRDITASAGPVLASVPAVREEALT